MQLNFLCQGSGGKFEGVVNIGSVCRIQSARKIVISGKNKQIGEFKTPGIVYGVSGMD